MRWFKSRRDGASGREDEVDWACSPVEVVCLDLLIVGKGEGFDGCAFALYGGDRCFGKDPYACLLEFVDDAVDPDLDAVVGRVVVVVRADAIFP